MKFQNSILYYLEKKCNLDLKDLYIKQNEIIISAPQQKYDLIITKEYTNGIEIFFVHKSFKEYLPHDEISYSLYDKIHKYLVSLNQRMFSSAEKIF